jgi:hypothetical protein
MSDGSGEGAELLAGSGTRAPEKRQFVREHDDAIRLASQIVRNSEQRGDNMSG